MKAARPEEKARGQHGPHGAESTVRSGIGVVTKVLSYCKNTPTSELQHAYAGYQEVESNSTAHIGGGGGDKNVTIFIKVYKMMEELRVSKQPDTALHCGSKDYLSVQHNCA